MVAYFFDLSAGSVISLTKLNLIMSPSATMVTTDDLIASESPLVLRIWKRNRPAPSDRFLQGDYAAYSLQRGIFRLVRGANLPEIRATYCYLVSYLSLGLHYRL